VGVRVCVFVCVCVALCGCVCCTAVVSFTTESCRAHTHTPYTHSVPTPFTAAGQTGHVTPLATSSCFIPTVVCSKACCSITIASTGPPYLRIRAQAHTPTHTHTHTHTHIQTGSQPANQPGFAAIADKQLTDVFIHVLHYSDHPPLTTP
jgi:hypothetical protein